MFQYDLTNQLVSIVLRECGGLGAKAEAHIADLLTEPFPTIVPGNPEGFAEAYLRYNLLRKSEDGGTDEEKTSAAMSAFLEAEERCRRWNEDRRRPITGLWEAQGLDHSLEALFHGAREKIHKVLGRFDLNEIAARVRYTSGASTRLSKRAGHPYFKFQGKPEVTPACALLTICDIWRTPLLRERFMDRCPTDPQQWVSRVAGSRLAFVPKTWKTHRTICLEPEGNMRWQCALGAVLKQRLRDRTSRTRYSFGETAKARGVDLFDQSYNQRLAEIGSYTGMLATIDLSQASDSVSLGLCQELLPPEWFDFICEIRSPYVQLPDGRWHKLEKVSSMGNGFTFELESLIFWALASSAVDHFSPSDQRMLYTATT